MIETFDRSSVLYANHLPADTLLHLREELVENRRRISDAGIGILLLETETDLRELKDRLSGWHIEETDGESVAFEQGLAMSYVRAVSSFHQAINSRRAEDLHEWRKWSKYHWLQLRLLKRVWPEELGPRNVELDLLTDELGEHHDLHVLYELLRQQEGVTDKAAAFLDEPASKRLAAIEALAISRGEELFMEDPHLFARRCAAYWKVWRQASCSLAAAAST